MWELPPRARRIQFIARFPINKRGTTSACAENTFEGQGNSQTEGNYLRVRGEYLVPPVLPAAVWELPPRARRIPPPGILSTWNTGTTSACAENTALFAQVKPLAWNYLRVRGEYLLRRGCGGHGWELPPRARRILIRTDSIMILGGTTSACAENTSNHDLRRLNRGNYLRVRGEYHHQGTKM